MKKILVFDNYDSFTYNLVHAVTRIAGQRPDVHRNDQISLEAIGQYDKIILSPGPGLPDEAGLLLAVIQTYAASKSILGVCLGHEAIGEVFGGQLINLHSVFHGVATDIYVEDEAESLFNGVPKVFKGGRYHSWAIDESRFPSDLHITARDAKGAIMAIAHKQYDVKGVQFHPESVLTEFGEKMLENWVKA